MQPLVFGSEEWRLCHRQDALFAVLGRYILRYDIPGNTIDKVIDLGEDDKGWPSGARFSDDGRYILSYSFDFGNEETGRNFFLLDLETESTELLCAEYDKETVEPYWFSVPTDETKLRIYREAPSGDTEAYRYFYTNSAGKTREITALQNLCAGDYICTGEDRIGAIVPASADGFRMGYYKFIIIDAASDEIVQECAILDF